MRDEETVMIDSDGTLTLSMSVTDRARSVGWYERHLGFAKLFDADDIGWTEMATCVPGVTIGFADSMTVDPGNCVPVFGVPDIAAARARLEGGGVVFTGPTLVHDGMVKLATFADPDGNLLMLAENLATDQS
jgi:CreA protein